MDQFKFEEVEQSWGSDNRGSNVSSSSGNSGNSGNSGSSGGISAGAFARFNSSDIPSDDDLDIEYESRPRFNDPQKMNPHKVRVLHFRFETAHTFSVKRNRLFRHYQEGEFQILARLIQ